MHSGGSDGGTGERPPTDEEKKKNKKQRGGEKVRQWKRWVKDNVKIRSWTSPTPPYRFPCWFAFRPTRNPPPPAKAVPPSRSEQAMPLMYQKYRIIALSFIIAWGNVIFEFVIDFSNQKWKKRGERTDIKRCLDINW